jgi:hypothetical protein
MLHDLFGQLPAGFVRGLLAQDAVQQLPAPRERELVTFVSAPGGTR